MISDYCFKDLADIKWYFRMRKYMTFITIAPDPKKGDPPLDKFERYCNAHSMLYWVVRCKSSAGFEHYHGIISFSSDMPEGNHDKALSSLHRFINRTYGKFNHHGIQDLDGLYQYVRCKDRNKNIMEVIGKRPETPNILD